jgi:sulfur carrier protein ThiS
VVVEVNGEPVDPDEYVLQGARSADAAGQGDRVRIVVRTS